MTRGLRTQNALQSLCKEIKTSIDSSYSPKSYRCLFLESIREKSIWPIWILVSSAFVCLVFFTGSLLDQGIGQLDLWNIFIILFALGIAVANMIMVVWIKKRKHKHKVDKVYEVCSEFQDLSNQTMPVWNKDTDYPSLYMPQSPDIHVQWTYRDGHLVSLPVILLVRDDVILLRPGQTVLATCEVGEGDTARTYLLGERYVPRNGEELTTMAAEPVCHSPMLPQQAVVKVPPIVEHLEVYLSEINSQHQRPSVSMLYFDAGLRITLGFSITCFILSLIISTLKYILDFWYISLSITDVEFSPLAVSYVFLIPAQVLYCGLPLTLPLLWTLLQCYAVGRLFYVFERSILHPEKLSGSMDGSMEDIEKSNFDTPFHHTFTNLCRSVKNEVFLQSSFRENLLLTMGTASAVCCVDKKGILSNASATPEKIFFFRRRHRHHSSGLRGTRKRSEASLMPRDISHTFLNNLPPAGKTSLGIRQRSGSEYSTQVTLQCQASPMNPNFGIESHPVTLDISSNPRNLYMPEFSDPKWQRYITSLKPIGLNLLLNNCNTNILPRYIQFADHLTAVANSCKRSVAVVNHRCLCGLASQIGFTPSATLSFDVESTLAIFRYNTAPATYCLQDSLNSALKQTTMQQKAPLANLFASVAVEAGGGGYQFMSQGTADLLADLCSDYWDGKDVVHMTEADKARILDFYNRNIFSAYCIGLAYSPLLEKLRMDNMDDILELAEDRLIKDRRLRNKPCNTKVDRSYSAESMMSRFSLQSVQDAEGYQRLLSNQIFLGMISMQYQAMPDVVETIERLEGSCIRFVHFSKENQLRSRVFAERLGLESGWNCHISLSESDSLPAYSHQPSASQSQHLYVGSSTLQETVGVGRLEEASIPLLAQRVGLQGQGGTLHHHHLNWEGGPNQEGEGGGPQHYGSAPTLYRNVAKAMEETSPMAGLVAADREYDSAAPPDEDCEPPCLISLAPAESVGSGPPSVHQGGDTEETFSTSSGCSEGSAVSGEDPNKEAIPSYFTTDKSKLPRGIRSIRPHLQNIDNVPLQVSLFTDCTPPAVCEMMSIMQEYGEIVCLLGSNLSIENSRLFVQADCSIGIVPVLPLVCLRKDPSTTASVPAEKDMDPVPTMATSTTSIVPSPLDLAAKLISLPCAISTRRDQGFVVLTLINESRYLVHNLQLSLSFLLVCLCSLSLVQALGSALLPCHLFSGRHLLWFQCLVATPLAAGVMGRRVERARPAKSPPQKRVKLFTRKTCCRFTWASIGRFLPSLLVCICTACANMYHLSAPVITNTFSDTENATSAFLNSSLSPNITQLSVKDFFDIQYVVSEFACVQLGIYLVIISFSYANYGQKIGTFRFLSNPCWCIVSIVILILQMMHLPLMWIFESSSANRVASVHVAVWSISALWTLFLLAFNEFISNKERLSIAAEHRLAKLYFATKLGMYSPV